MVINFMWLKGVYSIVVSENKPTDVQPVKISSHISANYALLYNQPRSATVKAETDGILWALDLTCLYEIHGG